MNQINVRQLTPSALTIDKSADLAQREIDELSSLISAMGDRVRA